MTEEEIRTLANDYYEQWFQGEITLRNCFELCIKAVLKKVEEKE